MRFCKTVVAFVFQGSNRKRERSVRSEQVKASCGTRSFEISCMWMSMSRISLFLSFSSSLFFVLLFSIVIHLDESRLTTGKRSSECYQHSSPLTTGTVAFFGQQTTTNSTPLYFNRRRPTISHSMTSYSALKRKAQRADVSSSTSRVSHLSFQQPRSKDHWSDYLVSSQSGTCPWFYFALQRISQSRSINNCLCSWVRKLISGIERYSNRISSFSSTVVLYDIQSQKQDFIINTARKAITSLALSPDGRYLATGEVRRTLSIELRFFTCALLCRPATTQKSAFGI